MTPTLAAAVSLAKAGTGVPAGHVSSLLSPGFQPRSLVPSFLAPISLHRGAWCRLLCILSSFFSFLSLAEWSFAWGSCPHVVTAPAALRCCCTAGVCPCPLPPKYAFVCLRVCLLSPWALDPQPCWRAVCLSLPLTSGTGRLCGLSSPVPVRSASD